MQKLKKFDILETGKIAKKKSNSDIQESSIKKAQLKLQSLNVYSP